MKYMSVCSGIEAASVAWDHLLWEPVAFSETDKYARKVLRHRFPNVPLHGNFTTIERKTYGAADLLVGGTPCQSFSYAGKRRGLDDTRGDLAIEFIKLAERIDAKWFIFENVPGLLNSGGLSGYDFQIFLEAATGKRYEIPAEGWGNAGIASGPRYGVAWRVLDAQYFGVPQKRRRLFVVGYTGNWRPPAAVLIEPYSLQGHSKPSVEKRKDAPAGSRKGFTFTARMTGFGKYECDHLAGTLKARDYKDATDLVCTIPIHEQACRANEGGTSRQDGVGNGLGIGNDGEPAHTLRCSDKHGVFDGYQVRKFTPTERERLMGFPDGWTLLDGISEAQRVKMTGNSMAVPVMRWLGERIDLVRGSL